jgi:endonuclease YncB( thermonuclease family)
VAASASLSAAGAAAQDVCPFTPAGSAEVAAVRDGRTLVLTDGRELRLAAIEVTEASRPALRQLAEGRPLRLATVGPARDRYGRLVAFAFASQSGQSLQHALLEMGAARVGTRIGSTPCARSLLTAEQGARAAGLGLWADPNFAPLAAENSRRLKDARGQFALVEGKVLSVRESGGTIYMNFARRWAEGFSLIIARRRSGAFTAAGLAPKRLEGRHVRVRGWIEMRRGPIIEADAPEQIELIDETGGTWRQSREIGQ